MVNFVPNYDDPRDIFLLADGLYNFKIIEVDCDAVTKEKKIPKITLKLEIIDSKQTAHTVYDNITLMPTWLFKLRHLCETTGIPEIYKTGKISNHDLIGKRGVAKIKTTEYNEKKYNKVDDYISRDKNPTIKPQTEPISQGGEYGEGFIDDKIPF